MNIIIPMAGLGKRMRPHTLTVPKPLLPIAGKPIVHRLVEDIAKVCPEKIDTIGFDANKDGTIDEAVPGGFQECELDNTLTFNKDSVSGVFDEGALKCDAADPQTIDFGYQLKGDSVINFSGNLPGELKGDVNILTISNTQLVMSKRIVVTFPVQFDKNLIISLFK